MLIKLSAPPSSLRLSSQLAADKDLYANDGNPSCVNSDDMTSAQASFKRTAPEAARPTKKVKLVPVRREARDTP